MLLFIKYTIYGVYTGYRCIFHFNRMFYNLTTYWFMSKFKIYIYEETGANPQRTMEIQGFNVLIFVFIFDNMYLYLMKCI